MGNNLLDALKKVGIADEKKAKKAENAKRQQQHRELKRGENSAQSALTAAANELDAQREKARAIENAAQQARDRLAETYRDAAVPNANGRKKFYFTTLERRIDCMMVSDVANALLERGKYAIVANETLDDYLVVRRATALAIEAIDKKRVVMMRRQET